MSKKMMYSKEAVAKISDTLNGEGIKFSFKQKKGAFTFSLPVRGAGEGLLRFYIFLNEGASYEIHALSPQKPDPFDDFVISQLYEFFSRVNQVLRKGCMFMNDDCEIWYKVWQENKPGELDGQALMDTVHMIVTDFCSYSYGVYRIMNHDLPPKSALEASDNTRKQLNRTGRIESKDEIEGLDRLFDDLTAAFRDKNETPLISERKADIREEENDDLTISLFEEEYLDQAEESVDEEAGTECFNLINNPGGNNASLQVIFANRPHFDSFLKMCATIQHEAEQDVKADWHITRLLETMKERYEESHSDESGCGNTCGSVLIPYTEMDQVYLAMEQAFRLYHALYRKYEKRKKTMHRMGETIKDLNDFIDKLTQKI